jgi:alkanesulfonate monooxygenase SsuD/methylene tetrahydromethanopterin reductase-like flavin-dependent oxidoreductase (luciferase family)
MADPITTGATLAPARPQIPALGIFDHLDASDLSLERQYAERLLMLEACDRAGFRGYHLAEHHGTPHGLAPSPNLFLAAAAQRTERLRLGPMVMLLNLYHPLRAFEEICMLDQISGGRADLGIGRGSVPMELAFFGVSSEDAEDRYREATEILLQAMKGGIVTHHGRHFDLHEVPMALAPHQRPHPPLWCGTTSPATAVWAADRGMNISCLGPAQAIRQVTDAYRARWGAVAAPQAEMPLLGMLRMIVVAPTDSQAHAATVPAYARWYETLVHLWRSRGIPAPYKITADLDGAIASGHCIIGSAATVRQTLLAQVAEAGATYVMCHIAFGDLPLPASLRTVAALEQDIMPALHRQLVA